MTASTQVLNVTQHRTFAKIATMFDFMEPLHILGAGSIGLLWAASIRSIFPNYPVQLLLRNHHKHRLILSGSSSLVPSRSTKVAVCLQANYRHNIKTKRPSPRIVHVPATLVDDTGAPFKNLLLTTKAFQALPAVEAIAHRLTPQTNIVIISNGALAIRELLLDFLQKRFSKKNGLPKIHLAMTTHGAYLDQDDADDEIFHVIHAGYGMTLIQDYPELAQLFDLSGLNCESSSSLDQHLWLKLAANCVINPLTAILECTNGEVRRTFEQERGIPFDSYITNIIQEISLVAQTLSVNAVGEDWHSVESLKSYVEGVIDATADNKSSMLQDVLAARPTEINYLNGFVVEQGQNVGVQCPFNQEIVNEILALSDSWNSQK